MCTALLPPGVNPIAANNIYQYHVTFVKERKAKLYFVPFPTSCLVEPGFTRVNYLLPKTSNRLHVLKTGDLRPASGLSNPCKCTSGPTHTLNVMAHGDAREGKLANAVGSQYPSHYLGTWCIQHYYR